MPFENLPDVEQTEIQDVFDNDEDRLRELERRDGFYSFLFHELESSGQNTVETAIISNESSEASAEDKFTLTALPTSPAASSDSSLAAISISSRTESTAPAVEPTNSLQYWNQLPEYASSYNGVGDATYPAAINSNISSYQQAAAIYQTFRNMDYIGNVGNAISKRNFQSETSAAASLHSTTGFYNGNENLFLGNNNLGVVDSVGALSGGSIIYLEKDDVAREEVVTTSSTRAEVAAGAKRQSDKVCVNNGMTTLRAACRFSEPSSTTVPRSDLENMPNIQTRESSERFSNNVMPLVRNRKHPLKNTPAYINWHKSVKLVDLRAKFPCDPDVHAPFNGQSCGCETVAAPFMQDSNAAIFRQPAVPPMHAQPIEQPRSTESFRPPSTHNAYAPSNAELSRSVNVRTPSNKRAYDQVMQQTHFSESYAVPSAQNVHAPFVAHTRSYASDRAPSTQRAYEPCIPQPYTSANVRMPSAQDVHVPSRYEIYGTPSTYSQYFQPPRNIESVRPTSTPDAYAPFFGHAPRFESGPALSTYAQYLSAPCSTESFRAPSMQDAHAQTNSVSVQTQNTQHIPAPFPQQLRRSTRVRVPSLLDAQRRVTEAFYEDNSD